LSGALLWTKGFGAPVSLAYADDRSVVLFVGEQGTPEAAIVGVDAATGAVRWRRSGLNGVVAAAGTVLGDTAHGESLGRPERGDEDPSRVARRLTALSTVDGALRWSVDLPDGTLSQYRLDDGQSGTVTVSEIRPDGLIRERALVSGAVVREVRAAVPGPPTEALIFDDVAVLLTGEVGDRVASAVDLSNGRLLWRRTGDVEALLQCGGVLCRSGADRSLEVVDRRTGATLWSASGLTYQGGDRDYLLLGDQPGEPTTVVEARTGRVMRRLGGWHVAGWSPDGMLVRGVGRPASLVYGRLDVRTGALTVLGVEHRSLASPYCRAVARYLVCAGGARFFVWPIDV
jgi:outer membrane protein assembly factor BamB